MKIVYEGKKSAARVSGRQIFTRSMLLESAAGKGTL